MIRYGVAVAVILAAAQAAQAQYHQPGQLVCSDCHTMHFSAEGMAPPYSEAGGPWGRLLKASTVMKLCLGCHDGTDPTAPDVVAPVGMYVGSGDEHSAGGYFGNSGGASTTSHDLGGSAVPPLSTAILPMSLTCATCHNPHGTSNYRNLVSNPVGGAGTTIVLGTNVFRGVAPAIPPTAPGSVAAYKRSNIGYKSNYSQWCAECHTDLKTNSAGSHFLRHPSNEFMNGAGYHTDTANWILATPNGVEAGEGATGNGNFGIPRVRFQVPGAANYTDAINYNYAGNAAVQVFCGSCHLAHGWKYQFNLVMPYKEGGADRYAGCIQCHNK